MTWSFIINRRGKMESYGLMQVVTTNWHHGKCPHLKLELLQIKHRSIETFNRTVDANITLNEELAHRFLA